MTPDKLAYLAALRRRFLEQADSTEIAAILESAFAEDDAEGGRFDAIGFEQFCPEDKPEDIAEAYDLYREYRWHLDDLGEQSRDE